MSGWSRKKTAVIIGVFLLMIAGTILLMALNPNTPDFLSKTENVDGNIWCGRLAASIPCRISL
jgi:hypothetical protein